MSALHVSHDEARYWRTVPHPFAPADWGPEYCLLCADPEAEAIHVDRESLPSGDPRRFAVMENPTGLFAETWWKVEAWDDDGGSTNYGFDHRTGRMSSRQAAEDYIAHLVVHGDDRGNRYQHYAVLEIRHYSRCTSLVHGVVDAPAATVEAEA